MYSLIPLPPLINCCLVLFLLFLENTSGLNNLKVVSLEIGMSTNSVMSQNLCQIKKVTFNTHVASEEISEFLGIGW